MTIRVFLFVLVACGSNKPAPEPVPAATSLVDCDRVADHVAATVDANRPRTWATHAAVHDMVNVRCKTDAWSDETKQCLYAIKTVQEGRACATGMTDVQREAIKKHARTLRGDASGSGDDDQSTDWVRHVVEE